MLVVSYYHSVGLRDFAAGVSALKLRYGIWFAACAGFCAGGLVPEIAKLATGGLRKFNKAWIATTFFNGFVYAIVAIQVDLFYRLQAFLFGPQHDIRTLVIKTAVDMGLFAPIISIPSATVLLVWRRNRFSLRPMFTDGLRVFILRDVIPGLIPCWFFWTPVLFCTYSMPVDLQLVFSTLMEAAWSIVFIFISNESQVPAP